jgi:PleD family two-component response regulator
MTYSAGGLMGFEAILHDADTALYAAKAAGRNRFHVSECIEQ